MSLPEISRRCLACGASVRAGARFCPQCGNRFAEEGSAEAGANGLDEARAPAPAEAPEAPRPAPPQWGAVPAAGEGEASGAARPARETIAPTRETVAPTRETATPAAPTVPPDPDGRADAGLPGGARVTVGNPFSPPTDAGGVPGEPAAEQDGGAAGEAEAGRSRRAAARVKETVMPRVGKMRDEALVALEETPDDSGLRFVLIAVVLFALFLLFLFLSTTVLR